MDWQKIISFGIVIITSVLLIHHLIKTNRNKKDCSNCELVKTKANIKFIRRK